MLSEPDVPVTGAFHEEEVTFTPDETVSDADRAFERYDLMTAPVVDDRGRLSAG
jgi:magnesium transporter